MYQINPFRILCFGDSNTYGYDPRSYFGERYDPECRWVDILQEKTKHYFINAGENGRTIPYHMPESMDNIDILLVMLGTNEILQGVSPEDVTNKMEAFLTSLPIGREKIILVAPVPFVRGFWVEDDELILRSHILAGSFHSLCAKLGVHFVDTRNWNIPLAFDGVHFTQSGHKIFAEKLLVYLNSMYSSNKKM